jgi:hypothetical protein
MVNGSLEMPEMPKMPEIIKMSEMPENGVSNGLKNVPK